MKRLISFVLLLTLLVLSFTACNGKSDEPVQNNGLINSKYYKIYGYTVWRGSDGYKDFHNEVKKPLDLMSEWGRTAWIELKVLNYDEINGTPLKKIQFDVVADRDVTVCFGCGYDGLNSPVVTTCIFKANQKKTVTLPLNATMNVEEKWIDIHFFRTNDGWDDLGFGSAAFKEFYQTQYKITNIELYSK